jgi:hypothetical protein
MPATDIPPSARWMPGVTATLAWVRQRLAKDLFLSSGDHLAGVGDGSASRGSRVCPLASAFVQIEARSLPGQQP